MTIAAEQGHAAAPNDSDSPRSPISVEVAKSSASRFAEETIAAQASKGFGLFWLGVEPAVDSAGIIHADVAGAIAGFNGNSAIVFARGALGAGDAGRPLRLLLAVTGTAYSSRAADVALALAQASAGTLTALYVDPEAAIVSWHQDLGGTLRSRRHGSAVLREVVELGRHYGIAVRGRVKYTPDAARAILGELDAGRYDLLVMGVTTRSGDSLFFGPVPSAVLAGMRESLLLVAT